MSDFSEKLFDQLENIDRIVELFTAVKNKAMRSGWSAEGAEKMALLVMGRSINGPVKPEGERKP